MKELEAIKRQLENYKRDCERPQTFLEAAQELSLAMHVLVLELLKSLKIPEVCDFMTKRTELHGELGK
jgi:hypothetical protein